jgi:hypothetical protein
VCRKIIILLPKWKISKYMKDIILIYY